MKLVFSYKIHTIYGSIYGLNDHISVTFGRSPSVNNDKISYAEAG